jgi:toxin-antitoxin system PIN domain toxin
MRTTISLSDGLARDVRRRAAAHGVIVSAFIRVVTNRRIFRVPSPTDVALDFVDQLTQRPTCRLVRPGPRHLGIFLDLRRRHTLVGGLVADAYHAALAIEAGCTWVTHDTDFARFDGLTWSTP